MMERVKALVPLNQTLLTLSLFIRTAAALSLFNKSLHCLLVALCYPDQIGSCGQ